MTIKRRHTEELPEHPDFLWKNPSPKKSYDVIVIGAGGHGLATAYYLAKNFGITNVAVLEKGWLAGGNMGRNTPLLDRTIYGMKVLEFMKNHFNFGKD